MKERLPGLLIQRCNHSFELFYQNVRLSIHGKILSQFLNIYTCLLKSKPVKMDAAWKNLGVEDVKWKLFD